MRPLWPPPFPLERIYGDDGTMAEGRTVMRGVGDADPALILTQLSFTNFANVLY